MKTLLGIVPLLCAVPASADDLYRSNSWAALSSDRRANAVGDLLTIVVYQSASATATNRSQSSRTSNLSGGINVAGANESGSLQTSSGFTGGGRIERSDSLVAQVTVTVEQVLPNGDLLIAGSQRLNVNGETTNIGVRGRVRTADISADNRVLSSRIADAQINYDGRGFVARSSRPGIINRIFRFLGLG